jgi:hypothetical protein
LLFPDASGVLFGAPILRNSISPLAVFSPLPSSVVISGNVFPGDGVSGFILSGPLFTGPLGQLTISGVPGATVSATTNGEQVLFPQPLNGLFTLTVSGLQVPAATQDTPPPTVLGTDARGLATTTFDFLTSYPGSGSHAFVIQTTAGVELTGGAGGQFPFSGLALAGQLQSLTGPFPVTGLPSATVSVVPGCTPECISIKQQGSGSFPDPFNVFIGNLQLVPLAPGVIPTPFLFAADSNGAFGRTFPVTTLDVIS